MNAIFYYLMTFAEAGLGAVGIRGVYEQPRYSVVERLPGGVEVRDYDPRIAAETTDSGDGSAAFSRLFQYITGSNTTGARIEMTAPVSRDATRIAMTVPVQSGMQDGTMRFFLPREVAAAGAPQPLDRNVRIVSIPPTRLAVVRFSGVPDRTSVAAHQRDLLAALNGAGRTTRGQPYLLTYDAPFTISFVRRNEVAVELAR